MFNPVDLPDTIPIFPLPGALLLPRARLPLNIFEPRYLAMLEDALKTPARLIGMVQPIAVPGKNETQPKLHRIGCVGRVMAFSETDDGRYMITLRGVSRFQIANTLTGFEPYMRAEVSWDGFAHDLGPTEKDPAFKRDLLLKTLRRYFDITGLKSDWGNLEKADEELLVNSLSMLCPFDIEDKQALLEAKNLLQRRETLQTLMEFAIASGGEGNKLQ
jgi:Lon protease-like protein